MEYLVSARPVITTRINGITADYDPHFFYVQDESPQGWALAIDGVMQKPEEELSAWGREAQAFVLQNKNWDIQGGRLCDFAQRVLDGKAEA